MFLLSGEKSIYQLFGLDIKPIFALSTIQVLGAAFFVILFTKGHVRCLRRSIPAAIITVSILHKIEPGSALATATTLP